MYVWHTTDYDRGGYVLDRGTFSAEASSRPRLSYEVCVGDRHHRRLGLSLVVGGEDNDVGLDVGLWWLKVYLRLAFLPWSVRRWSHAKAEQLVERWKAEDRGRPADRQRSRWAHEVNPFDGRETGASLSWFDGDLVWRVDLWVNPMSGASWARNVWPWESTGWGWHVNLSDLVLGDWRRVVLSSVPLPVTVEVPGDGRYPASTHQGIATVERWRAGRTRLWALGLGVVEGTRVELELEDGPWRPGKGTCAHNCEPEQVTHWSAPLEDGVSVEDALRINFNHDVADLRRRYPL